MYIILYKALFHNKKDIKESKQIKSYCYKFKVFKYLKKYFQFYICIKVHFFFSDALLL